MKKTLTTLLCATLITSANAEDGSRISLHANGLRLVAPSYSGEDRMRAYNHTPGLNLVFLGRIKRCDQGCGFQQKQSHQRY